MSGRASDEFPLAPLRVEIDAVDAEIVGLLARRLGIVERVIAIKQEHGLPALLPDRVEEVVAHVREKASQGGVPPDLAETLWRAMIDWTIAYEERRLPEPRS
ncbi:chorismate mutase [Enterovirga rhinocerotis]|uniref:chorismate mutase n=1 Tax=Enterovirga rhinocerotis TaxID=1339210 RepID=A0A4R7C748_9HYPH|nr:chorismate mutase [Enterovirga rhinocerotis]TDR94434.1 isochorismate pyruvate lyase [Enterovirga rhinocerotis]